MLLLSNVFLLFLFMVLSPFIENAFLSRSLAQYSPLVQAINQYKLDLGEYPVGISDLVPKYVVSVPDPDDALGYDLLTYEPSVTASKEVSIIGSSPAFALSFFKSFGAIGGEKMILYCPQIFSCLYEVNFPMTVRGKVVLERRELAPERIDDEWVYIKIY